ncbi:MAG TPA: hypothetical protein VI072_30095 [Polyangiaceae bacterium]
MAARDGLSVSPPRPLDVNYDEAAVPAYTLPDALSCSDGKRAATTKLWFERRRPELLAAFAREMYGEAPREGWTLQTDRARTLHVPLEGALRCEWHFEVRTSEGRLPGTLLVWAPAGATEPVPVFVGLNFFGNQSVHPDATIEPARGWVPNNPEYGLSDHRASDASRGCHAHRWPVADIVRRGYALATCYAGDFDPDFDDGFRNGAHALFPEHRATAGDGAWGAIGAWAWGMSRLLDVLEADDRVDLRRVIAIGHSRFGKTALWAAAQDARFAMAISNCSGRGGAALSRRAFGERVRHLNERFPHWFCGNFRRYGDREAKLPFDQHALLALMAPRPVYVASASEDLWADPQGEFLACQAAGAVYEALGDRGADSIGYHVRPGVHDITAFDWAHYLDFADAHLWTSHRQSRRLLR